MIRAVADGFLYRCLLDDDKVYGYDYIRIYQLRGCGKHSEYKEYVDDQGLVHLPWQDLNTIRDDALIILFFGNRAYFIPSLYLLLSQKSEKALNFAKWNLYALSSGFG